MRVVYVIVKYINSEIRYYQGFAWVVADAAAPGGLTKCYAVSADFFDAAMYQNRAAAESVKDHLPDEFSVEEHAIMPPIARCPECTALASYDEYLEIWKCNECEWEGELPNVDNP